MSKAFGSSRGAKLSGSRRAQLAGIPIDLCRSRQARRGAGSRDRRRRDDKRRERRRGGRGLSTPPSASESAKDCRPRKSAVRRRGRRADHGRRPSPFGVDAEPRARAGRADFEAGVDWRGLHMFAGCTKPRCRGDDRDAPRDHDLRRQDRARSSTCPCPSSTSAAGSTFPARGRGAARHRSRRRHTRTRHCATAPELLATTRFSLELGRWLVGEAGVYLTRVLDRTESCGKTFLTIDGGGQHLLARDRLFAASAGAAISRSRWPIASARPAEEKVTVTGCLCTPLDVLGDEVCCPGPIPATWSRSSAPAPTAFSASPRWESRPPAREIARLGVGASTK